MKDSFLTLARTSEGQYKEKSSRFLSFAFPVVNTDEADSNITSIRKKYHDSRHICFAWRFGPEGENARAFDAGEPMHSAGVPILNQIRSNELTNVLIVVVRYFGGIQLGIGGLIAAYGEAARDAIRNNDIVEEIVQHQFSIRFSYEQTAIITRIIHRHKLKIIESKFEADCFQVLSCRLSEHEIVAADFEKSGIFIEN